MWLKLPLLFGVKNVRKTFTLKILDRGVRTTDIAKSSILTAITMWTLVVYGREELFLATKPKYLDTHGKDQTLCGDGTL
jgi:hypothetical protein